VTEARIALRHLLAGIAEDLDLDLQRLAEDALGLVLPATLEDQAGPHGELPGQTGVRGDCVAAATVPNRLFDEPHALLALPDCVQAPAEVEPRHVDGLLVSACDVRDVDRAQWTNCTSPGLDVHQHRSHRTGTRHGARTVQASSLGVALERLEQQRSCLLVLAPPQLELAKLRRDQTGCTRRNLTPNVQGLVETRLSARPIATVHAVDAQVARDHRKADVSRLRSLTKPTPRVLEQRPRNICPTEAILEGTKRTELLEASHVMLTKSRGTTTEQYPSEGDRRLERSTLPVVLAQPDEQAFALVGQQTRRNALGRLGPRSEPHRLQHVCVQNRCQSARRVCHVAPRGGFPRGS
jgi:hypothetical protein